MEDSSRTVLQDFHRASRKAEESALRRFQASAWLESFIGPLGLSDQPSEQEFVSCLRNGLVLCKVINKIQPGIVPKVIESHHNSSSPAYQYFENVRNFLVAVKELNVPAFEASDLERDFLEAGSTAKIVDCVLSLKSYHEWKQWSNGCVGMNGPSKHLKSPMILRSAGRNQSRVAPLNSAGPCRHLDMAVGNERPSAKENENWKLEDPIIGALVDCMLESKENIDHKLLASLRNGTKDTAKVFSNILSNCLQGQQLCKFPELKSNLHDPLLQHNTSISILTESPASSTAKCKLCCLNKGDCNHWKILKLQEKDLLNLKMLLSTTKNDFEVLQSHLQNDLHALENKVQEISVAAVGYQRVIKENRDLYNTVQDLKGNIRVYCRIRPVFGTEARSAIDHIGDDGSLVVLDPSKPHKDARKVFQFNRVFGPTSGQDEVYKETQPLIRSVLDGYNVCIFAYGQTGSGKTHTMCGPSGGSTKDMGINYLALNDLFDISCMRKNIIDYEIHVQMVEIYNEQVRDLLTESSSTTKLEIRNCTSNGGLTLPGATLHAVKSSMDVLDLMKVGELNRCVSSTAMNLQSSRSHSVLTVHVHGKDISGNLLRSCLHLVDLAGSERVDKSEVTGDRLKEAQAINKSLSCLGDVITALAQKNSHIPYRNSKLTQLLQGSLGGHAKTLMFAHVSPEADSFGETVSTLKFAQRVSTVELGAAHLNKESREVKDLKEQVETLKRQLSSKVNEIKSPREKLKTTDRTPPRPRRLSIENSAVKPQRTPPRSRRLSIENSVTKSERTPPRSRRLSIENSDVKPQRTPPRSRRLSIENSEVKPQRTPPRSRRLSIENSVTKSERTPPRSRRLSIENSAVKTEKPVNTEKVSNIPDVEGKHKTDSISRRPRRLISDASKRGRDQLQNIVSENIFAGDAYKVENSQCVAPSEVTCQDSNSDYGILQNAEVDISDRSHSGANHASLGSPASVGQSKTIGTETRLRRAIHLLNTPEHSYTPSEFSLPKSPIHSVAVSTSKKRSQIRRSLHTIGKLINPSDKRSRQQPATTLSTANGVKSPLGANTRTLRRQSLTGGQTSESSRRSSLGGKPSDSCPNGKRNAKTPPPVRESCRGSSQWL